MIVKKISVATGEYQKDGQTKKRWKEIGQVHEHEGRQYITLDPLVNLAAIPRKPGDDRVFCSLFEPENRQKPKADDFPDDDVPF